MDNKQFLWTVIYLADSTIQRLSNRGQTETIMNILTWSCSFTGRRGIIQPIRATARRFSPCACVTDQRIDLFRGTSFSNSPDQDFKERK